MVKHTLQIKSHILQHRFHTETNIPIPQVTTLVV